MTIGRQLQFNLAPGPLHEEEADDVRAEPDIPVRLFAFFLPQFHSIPENDDWWGKGFTEWTNVTKALPRFEGHYQPQLPADLGFYDLRLPETIRQQVSLARRYGIAGFCFHWYWFGGHRLLERPLQIFLEDRDIDFPFFINWANENWTRRWDGLESTVLMRQSYSEEDDLAVADAFLELVKDPRYVRIDGRPLLMVYRPAAMPDARASVARWRHRFIERGEQDPFILMPQVFDDIDPRRYEMDAAVQFPPQVTCPPIDEARRDFRFFEGHAGGVQFDYEEVAAHACNRSGDGYPLFRGVCPGWDNEARKPSAGVMLRGSTPRRYGRWMARAIRSTLQEKPLGQNLVFVNAWNEWAEGAHLEPDRHFGHAYLRETCRALNAARDPGALDRYIGDDVPGERLVVDPALHCHDRLDESVENSKSPSSGSPDQNARGLVRGTRDTERDDGHNDDPFEVAGMLRAWMPKNRRVLDVGCGTGSVTVIVNRYKKNDVVCIEPDLDRARRAQSRDLYVHCGELDNAFIERYGRFDVVVLSEVLAHLANPSAMLTAIRASLVPNGIFLLSVPNVAHWSVRFPLLVGRFEYEPAGIRNATHLRWFTAKSIGQLVREHGFEVIKIAQTSGQDLPDYHRRPWRWLPRRVTRNLAKLGTRWMPLLFGCQHVVMCRPTVELN